MPVAPAILVERITSGVTGYRTPPKPLWIGEHVALVKFPGYSDSSGFRMWHPARVELATVADGGRGGYRSASLHRLVWTVTQHAGVDPRYGPRIRRERTGPLTREVLAMLIAEAERDDAGYPVFREERLAEIEAEQRRDEQARQAEAAERRLVAAAPGLLAALDGLLKHYVGLVNSGDAGNWNPETEPVVIAARAAIRKARGEESTGTVRFYERFIKGAGEETA